MHTEGRTDALSGRYLWLDDAAEALPSVSLRGDPKCPSAQAYRSQSSGLGATCIIARALSLESWSSVNMI